MNKIYHAVILSITNGIIEDAYFFDRAKAQKWANEEIKRYPFAFQRIEEIEMYDDSKIMPMKRKAKLYDELLGYLVELIHDKEELQNALLGLGFTMDEIRYECLEYEEDEEQ